MKVLAIGDIHAKQWIITEALSVIDKYDKLIFIGDYCDDWNVSPMENIKTWQYLKDSQEKYPNKIRLVTGNHDYSYVNDVGALSSGYNKLTQALINFPENKDLKRWVSELPISIVEDGVTYSHAGLTEEWMSKVGECSLWGDGSPLWVRPSDWYNYRMIPQVFGHTPSETCWEVDKNIWCIDTFSTDRDGIPIGDGTMLEIVNGKKFSKIKIEVNKNTNDNDSTSSIEKRISS